MSKTLTFVAALILVGAWTVAAKPTPAQRCAASVRTCCGKLFLKLTLCHAKSALDEAVARGNEILRKFEAANK